MEQTFSKRLSSNNNFMIVVLPDQDTHKKYYLWDSFHLVFNYIKVIFCNIFIIHHITMLSLDNYYKAFKSYDIRGIRDKEIDADL